MAQNLNNPINRAGGPVDDRTEVQHESDIDSLESTYVGQLVHVRDNDKFFRIKSVDVLGSPTSKEVVAYTEITSDKIASWNGKQDAISSTNTLSPNSIKDTTMNGKLAAYDNSGVLGSSGIDTANIAVKSEMSITDGTGADAGTATIQLNSDTSKKVLTQHQSLEGKVDKVAGKSLSTNDYDNTEKGKVANAIQMPSGVSANKVLGYENGNVAWVDKPQDGEKGDKGDKGEDAVNPFKGYYPTGVSKPATGAVGDYLYATPSDPQSSATATIWHYDSTQTPPWTDTEIDVSAVVGVEFGSGQSVPATKIRDENGEEVRVTADVLSSEAGVEINEYLKDLSQIFAIENDSQINAVPITLSDRGQYVSKTGTNVTEGTQNWRQSQPIAVSKGQVVVVYGASTGDGTIIALTDEEETFYTPVIIANDTIKPHFYKVVEDGYVVVQCYYLRFHSAFIVNDSPRINDILEKIATLNETRYEDRVNLGSLLFDYKLKINEWVFEYGNINYQGANEGGKTTTPYFMRTRDFLSTENVGLIKVPQGLKFNRVCYYDSNNVFKLQEDTNLTSEYEVKTIYPYFRFAIANISGYAKINLGQTIQDKIDEVESQIGAITNVDTFTFDIVGDQYGFTSKSIDYNFVNGKMYHVSIETLDNRYETYLSVRDTSGTTLIGSIIRGKGKRDGFFTCNVDGGTKLYMTVVPAYATSTYVVKINRVVKSVDDRLNQIEPIYTPTYTLEEKQRVYNELIDRVNTNAAVFAFNTDQHLSYRNNGDTMLGKRWVLEGAKMLDELAYELPIDLVVLGGDSAGYYDNRVPIILKGINELTNTFQRCKCLVGIPGNHEAFQNDSDITPKAMYNTYGKINSFNPKFVSSNNNTDACVCNGYIDDAYHKIRYIFIDIYSGYTNESGNETYRVNICRTYLEQTLNSMSNEYNAIIMSHRPLTTEFSGIVKMEDTKPTNPQLPRPVMIDAFANPAELQDVLYNHKEQIIACICGHSHADVYAYSQTSGILYIETTCAMPDAKYLFDNIPFSRKLSALDNAPSYPWLTAYDIFVVNQEEKTIEALRYGQGTNRKWRYKSDGTNQAELISYKNCVNGYIMNGTTPVTTAVVFTNTEDGTDEVSVTPDSKGFFETYLTLNATYNITCSGFTLDVPSVTVNENKSLNIKATPTT